MSRLSPMPSGRRSRPGVVAVLLAALLLVTLSHPLIHGDGISYFMYLDSVATDGDLDLSNQVVRFAPAIVYPFALSRVTGTPVTPFPFGSAYLLAPFYQLGRRLEPIAPTLRAYPEHFTTIQGLSLAYSLMVSLGALLYALAAVALAYSAARQFAPAWAAGLAAICCLAGTPLLYYATIEPLDAHIYGACALALALWLVIRAWPTIGFTTKAQRRQADLDLVSWRLGAEKPAAFIQSTFAIGLALGLAVLVRWQLLLYALPIGGALILTARRGAAPSASPQYRRLHAANHLASAWGAALAFVVGLGLYCALCMLYFWRFFGSPLVVPNDAITGRPFVSAPLRYLPQVLLSRHNGWLSWSPVAVLGLVGLAGIAWWRPGRWRAFVIAGLVGIGLQLALNASIDDWYGGWSFGLRRMAEAYPLLAIGLAWLVSRPRWGRLFAGAAVICTLYAGLLLVGHLYYTHTAGHPEGGSITDVVTWLLSGPHGPTVFEVFRDRYGPWAWPKPEL